MLTAAVRIACEAAAVNGTPWQAVINGLRASVQEIWQGLSDAEQARFLRHVRPFWDAHRHRLPIEVHGRIQSELNTGAAILLQARVKDVVRHGGEFEIRVSRRGSADETLRVDLAFDCSGHAPDLEQPLVRNLIGQGLARPDSHRLGLAVARSGAIQGAYGSPTTGLFALGPLCQGSLWEITAVPEIVAQADQAATAIAALSVWHSRRSGTAHVHSPHEADLVTMP